ncbi:TPA: hypothetical protein EYP70_05325 [Candidatus Bathyarchaeota archaeon]|nr:hypothetical protein [Candidatus Bathyarchaeota archaeon]
MFPEVRSGLVGGLYIILYGILYYALPALSFIITAGFFILCLSHFLTLKETGRGGTILGGLMFAIGLYSLYNEFVYGTAWLSQVGFGLLAIMVSFLGLLVTQEKIFSLAGGLGLIGSAIGIDSLGAESLFIAPITMTTMFLFIIFFGLGVYFADYVKKQIKKIV